ncbi:hypothetical protein A2372_00810 [Candidatus Wolfebacteria bacterium RIFOXYB1_FULL_54_12]|uniref:Pyridoxamine 5'-phosphate oxidase N-terminal domain-containing protein n=1 Tax=Candidatus Wolfebacteria bacterium RIFOXYB1_FULL_54_12 TaxID=1802559 RepID=A0A1F8DVS1_9BACT|nr:MAG: hypothetical protein A2372_00810 [Candidatus Wolfebacteria bacterium RIFOXYB1_FULL_54_12]
MANKESLLAYLKSQNLMSLATYGEAPANCAVYFAVDGDFSFYFISEPDSEHCTNIAKNPRVACVIADSHQVVSTKKIGAQIKGTVEDVTMLEQFDAIINLWNSTNPGMEAIISINNFRNKILKSRAYKIRPTTIKFFNEELYGEEGFELFPFEQPK